MRRRFALVYNAQAGSALPRLLDVTLRQLRDAGARVFQLPARSAEEARDRVVEAAAQESCDAVIAAGGDGTFRAAATGAAGTGLAVGIIPLGTGNVLARELNWPTRASGIAECLRSGPERTITASLVNGAPFFLWTGAGFDGRIISGLSYGAKRVLGRAAYTTPILSSLASVPERFDVTVDGEPHRVSWVIVTRASLYGGFTLTDKTQIGNDPMIAVMIDATTRRHVAKACAALAAGRWASDKTRPSFITARVARRVEVGHRHATLAQIDGDEAGATPLVIEKEGPAVSLIVPPAPPA